MIVESDRSLEPTTSKVVGRRGLLRGAGVASVAIAAALPARAAAAPIPAAAATVKSSDTWLNVRSYGIAGKGNDDSIALHAMLKSLKGQETVVHFPAGEYKLKHSTTIPDTISLVLDKGAILAPAADVVVKVEATVDAGLYQIFGGDGDVVGTFGTRTAAPQWWGAAADGTTDDTTAINSAIDAMAAAGGGTVRLAAGTYILGTVSGTGNGLIIPKSNVNIIGEGNASVLKVADNLNGNTLPNWTIIYPSGSYGNSPSNPLDNVLFRDFKVDANGANNLDTLNRRHNVIGTSYGHNITIERITMVNNASRQCFEFGSNHKPQTVTDLIIKDCYIDTVAAAVPGNTTQDDHSSFYVQADRCLITGNTFINPPVTASTVATALEIHSSNCMVSNNIVKNFRQGVNIIATVTDQINSIYENNVLQEIEASAFFFELGGSNVMKRVQIRGNVAERRSALPNNSSFSRPVIFAIGGTPQDVLIADNDLTYVGDASAYIAESQSAGNASTNQATGITLGSFRDVRFVRNRIVGTIGPAIAMGLTYYDLPDDETTIEIADNHIIDCCRIQDSDADGHTAILLNSAHKLRSLKVTGNEIVNTGSTASMVNGVRGTAGLAYAEFVDNTCFGTTTDVSWASSASIDYLMVRQTVSGGDPEGVVRASSGSRVADSTSGDVWHKRTVDTSASGWWLERYAAAPPTSGTYRVGDTIRNLAPAAGAPEGWICVAAGSPGTFKAFGTIAT